MLGRLILEQRSTPFDDACPGQGHTLQLQAVRSVILS